jgi:hypothetical protein
VSSQYISIEKIFFQKNYKKNVKGLACFGGGGHHEPIIIEPSCLIQEKNDAYILTKNIG